MGREAGSADDGAGRLTPETNAALDRLGALLDGDPALAERTAAALAGDLDAPGLDVVEAADMGKAHKRPRGGALGETPIALRVPDAALAKADELAAKLSGSPELAAYGGRSSRSVVLRLALDIGLAALAERHGKRRKHPGAPDLAATVADLSKRLEALEARPHGCATDVVHSSDTPEAAAPTPEAVEATVPPDYVETTVRKLARNTFYGAHDGKPFPRGWVPVHELRRTLGDPPDLDGVVVALVRAKRLTAWKLNDRREGTPEGWAAALQNPAAPEMEPHYFVSPPEVR